MDVRDLVIDHYSGGDLAARILDALEKAGVNTASLTVEDWQQHSPWALPVPGLARASLPARRLAFIRLTRLELQRRLRLTRCIRPCSTSGGQTRHIGHCKTARFKCGRRREVLPPAHGPARGRQSPLAPTAGG